MQETSIYEVQLQDDLAASATLTLDLHGTPGGWTLISRDSPRDELRTAQPLTTGQAAIVAGGQSDTVLSMTRCAVAELGAAALYEMQSASPADARRTLRMLHRLTCELNTLPVEAGDALVA